VDLLALDPRGGTKVLLARPSRVVWDLDVAADLVAAGAFGDRVHRRMGLVRRRLAHRDAAGAQATHRRGPRPRAMTDLTGRRQAPVLQPVSSSATRRATGQAPSEVFDTTVHVRAVPGSWTLRNDTPAS
jgi:hypothetical protein